MEWTRNLKRYMTGEDVRYVKDRLVELGYLHKATHNRYGDDTYRAVKAFENGRIGVPVHGIIERIQHDLAPFG